MTANIRKQAFLILMLLGCLRPVVPQTAGGRSDGYPVLLRVSVTDSLNRFVSGLGVKSFKVIENRATQSIGLFRDASAPVCVGVVIDSTPGLHKAVESLRAAIPPMFQSGDPADEFFVVTFDKGKAGVQTFNRQGSRVEPDESFGRATGLTGLQDAIYVGMDQLKKRTIEKRALLVVTDAGMVRLNSALAVCAQGKEPDFQVFSIGRGVGAKPVQPSPVVDMTAGSAYTLTNLAELDYYVGLVVSEVRSQYVLGYTSSNLARDGKPRRIMVEMNLPPDGPKLLVKAKRSYDLPKEWR